MKNRSMAVLGIMCAFLALKVSDGETSVSNQARSFPLPQHGKLILDVPTTWRQDIRQPPGDLPPTLTLSPEQGDEFQVMITPLWSPTNDATFNEPEAVKRLIEADLRNMLPGAVEKQVSVQEFKGIDGTGYYFLVTDKAPKPGEYPYAIRAGIGVGDLLLGVTILCRSKDTTGIAATIKALEKAVQKKE